MDLKFPGSPQDELPFPLGLKRLVTNRASVSDFTSSDLKVTVENTLDNCDFKMLNEPFVLRASCLVNKILILIYLVSLPGLYCT